MAGAVEKIDLTLYGGRDPRDLPVYSLDRAACLLLLPKTTLKAWVFGQEWRQKGVDRFFKPLITPPDPAEYKLSFVNLVEAHVLKAVRRKHLVQMEKVRDTLNDLKQSRQTDHPLADIDLLAGGRELYTEQGQLLNLTMGRQVAMAFLKVYLSRVERQLNSEKAVRLFPFVNAPIRIGKQIVKHDEKIVAIDPYTSFGRPVISGTGIPTKEIADRVWGGDSITDVMEDFGRTQVEVEYALRWEHAQAVHAWVWSAISVEQIEQFSKLTFFTDQCLAGRAIATAVSVASGCLTKQFAHYFPTDTHDIDWLPHIGRWGWILLTKDWDIQDNVTERTAMLNAGVRAFVLRDERLPRDVIIEVLRFNLPRMLRMIARYQAPFIVAIESQAGGLTPLSALIDIDPAQK